MTRFDDDTALVAAGEQRWHGEVREHWSNGSGPGINGGLFAAFAARAAELATRLPPRSLTIHYLSAPAAGGIEIAATVPRQGRWTAFVRLEFSQDGRHVAQAIAVCTEWRADAPAFADTPPPPVRPREECRLIRPEGIAPPMVANYELFFDFEPDRRPSRLGGWIRTADARAADHLALAAFTDAFMPPAFFRLDEPVIVATLELTIHFRAEAPPGEHPWVQGWFSSGVAAGGVVAEDGELWSEDGVLLAQSRQLAVMRHRPKP